MLQGRVFLTGTEQSRFWSKVNKTENCWIWIAGSFSNGYGQFWFRGIPTSAHRIAWLIENGEIPYGKVVCHSCDKPLCVNPSHLFLGTYQENMNDCKNKGRTATGLNNVNGRLSESDVLFIRGSSLSSRELGRVLSVDHSTVLDIRNNFTHKESVSASR